MQYQEFLRRVEDQIGTIQPASETQPAAGRAITATLETLSERLTDGQANNLAAQLPGELQAPLRRTDEEAEDFSLEEFYRRVSEREGVDIDRARNDVSAVMTVLRLAVTGGELDNLIAQLPSEFNALFL